MSLLQKASIITTPTAYAEDYLYSIKPAEYLGAELTTNGGFDTDSDWTKGTGWSIANGKASFNGGADAALTQSNVVQPSTLYRVLFTVLDRTTGSLQLRLGNSGVVDVTVDSNSDFTFDLTTDTSGTSVYFRAIGGFDGSIDNVSVKEIIQADFDFTRNSTGTRVNEDYLIEDVPYNLVLQSNQFDTSWTLFQGGTVTGGQPDKDFGNNAWKLNVVSTQAFSGLYQARTLTGVTTLSIFAKAGTLSHLGIVNLNGTGFAIWFNLSNGTIGTKDASVSNANMQNLGNGWYRCSFTQDVSAAGYFQLKPSDGELTPSTTSGFVYIQNAQLVKGDQPKDYLKTTDRLDIPRIDYTNGEPSILLEPSRTNLIANNSDASAWGGFNNNVTFNLNDTTSPEGITNGHKINETTDNGQHKIDRSFSATSGTTYTYSLFAKKGTNKNVAIRVYGDNSVFTSQYVKYDLEKGTLTSGDGKIENYGNGWYRIYVTRTAAATATGFFGINLLDSNGNASYAGSTDNHIFIYGNQLEAGSYATSLIHTSGSAVTRSADVANNAGNSDLFNDSEGVLYAEILPNKAPTGTYQLISISDSGTNNSVTLGTDQDSVRLFIGLRLSGSYQALFQPNANFSQYQKIAISYKVNQFKLYINGTQVDIDTSGSVFSANTLNSLHFSFGSSSHTYKGNVKMVAVFKEALTDTELEKLTGYNNHELYMNYYNRLSYLGLAEEYNVESDINNYIL